MKRYVGLSFILFFLAAAPALLAQNHGEAGVFAEYFRFEGTAPVSNFVGIGGRAAFNMNPNVQLEAEMAYDFERNFTSTYTNGISTSFATSKLRPLHGLFGPKFDFGTGAFRLFVTGKVGFENLTVTNSGAPTGFVNAVGLGNGATYFEVYPGVGVEAFFAGPIGVRLEAGDDIYFNGGANNNFRISFGPQFRF